jgi:hypothetical protein
LGPGAERRGRRSSASNAGNATFTWLLRADNGVWANRSETDREMETTSRFLFIALVTGYLLGRIIGGAAAPAEVVVYGLPAAFGLEYLVASWGGIWQRS